MIYESGIPRRVREKGSWGGGGGEKSEAQLAYRRCGADGRDAGRVAPKEIMAQVVVLEDAKGEREACQQLSAPRQVLISHDEGGLAGPQVSPTPDKSLQDEAGGQDEPGVLAAVCSRQSKLEAVHRCLQLSCTIPARTGGQFDVLSAVRVDRDRAWHRERGGGRRPLGMRWRGLRCLGSRLQVRHVCVSSKDCV